MEASLAEPEGSIGFHAIKGDPGAATVENMLSLADRLAFIKKLDLPRDMLTGAGDLRLSALRHGGAADVILFKLSYFWAG